MVEAKNQTDNFFKLGFANRDPGFGNSRDLVTFLIFLFRFLIKNFRFCQLVSQWNLRKQVAIIFVMH